MHLQVIHETCYDYLPPVEVAQHVAYLQPWSNASQQLLDHHLRVEPRPAQQLSAVDVYGNRRTFVSLQTPHSQLRVIATSTVVTTDRVMPGSALAWEQVRERFRYRADAPYDPGAEFVFASQHAPRHPDFAAYARPSFVPGARLFDGACDLMHRIHHDFTYESQSTQINTPALEAMAQRKGVCQDFAHIMVACLRSLGLAARYVSGYLLTEAAPGMQRLIGSDASHAWVSVLLPDLPSDDRWCDFDPTNDRWGWGLPGEDYVLLATGRDYADVSPIRGVIHGGTNHHLTVAVTVTRLEPPAPSPSLHSQSQVRDQDQDQFQSQSQNQNQYG